MRQPLRSLLFVLLFLLPLAAATRRTPTGQLFTSCDAVTSTGACDAALYMKPDQGDTLPNLHTWTLTTGGTGSYSALSVILEGSIDGSNWFTVDTATATGGRSLKILVQYLRCNPQTLTIASGSPTLTCSFISTRGSDGGYGDPVTVSGAADGVVTDFSIDTSSVADKSRGVWLAFVNGVLQDPSTYSVTSTSLHFTYSPPDGAEITLFHL